jgi:hypothetical protein
MTDQLELDRLLDAFFVDGTNELADRVIDAALDQIDHTNQRRRIRAPWRFPTMTMPVRIAAAAVIGVLVVGGAAYLVRPKTLRRSACRVAERHASGDRGLSRTRTGAPAIDRDVVASRSPWLGACSSAVVAPPT